MSYRKIEVNGKTYEYVIGKTNIKIKGVGVFSTVEVGDESARKEFGEDQFRHNPVTPADIRKLIINNGNPSSVLRK